MIQLILPVTAVITATKLLAFGLLFLFFAPVIFQSATGLKALKGKIKLKFWMVCMISLLVQVLSSVSLFMLALHNMRKSEIREGLGLLFIEYAGAFMVVILLFLIFIQWFINDRKKNINALQ